MKNENTVVRKREKKTGMKGRESKAKKRFWKKFFFNQWIIWRLNIKWEINATIK